MSNYSKHVYTPLDVANIGIDEARRIKDSSADGINMPMVPGTNIHEYFARVMPWEVVAVVGQTHNGKTLFTSWWEHGICEQLKQEGRIDEVVVHVSLEESLEAMAFQAYSRGTGIQVKDIASGNVDIEKLEGKMEQVAGINIYRIADSRQVEDDDTKFTLSNIYRMIVALKNGEVTGEPVKIAAIFVDYLQALPIDDEVRNSGTENKRRLQVRNDVYRLRKMTVHIGAPIVVNVQAKLEMRNPRPPYHIPGINDGEETSSIGQRFDRIIGIWMPKVDHYRVGETVPGLGYISEDLFFIKVSKQRGGLESGKTFGCRWNFRTGQLLSQDSVII